MLIIWNTQYLRGFNKKPTKKFVKRKSKKKSLGVCGRKQESGKSNCECSLFSSRFLKSNPRMSSHQVNQANPQITGTYQYQFGDSVVEIPSNINYQLENVISSGGVSIAYIFIESCTSHINNFEDECIRPNKYSVQPDIQKYIQHVESYKNENTQFRSCFSYYIHIMSICYLSFYV